MATFFLLITVAACQSQGGPVLGQRSGTPGHVFVINLENKGYDRV